MTKPSTLIIGLVLVLGLFSCSKGKELEVGSASTDAVTKAPEIEEKVAEIDILEPEVEVDEKEEYFQRDIFELWNIFFKSFVAVVNETPKDTRVDFKLLHKLRSEKDKDFLNLVSIIEEKMASTDLRGKSREFKGAFYINAYNYSAIRLVNKGYINNDGEIVENLLKLSKTVNPFEILTRKAIAFRQGILSLDELQKEKLKEVFSDGEKTDARFLLAINSVAMSKATILDSAFKPDTLEDQLTFAARNSLQLKRIATIDEDRLEVSRFFKWYKKTFEADSGSIESFIQKYGIEKKDYKKLRYQKFSWDLNDLASFPGSPVGERDPKLPPIRDNEVDSTPDKDAPQQALACDFLKSDTVEVLGLCDKVIEGIQNGAYTYENVVEESGLCLYSRTLEDGKKTLGIMGDITNQNVKSGRTESTKLAVEGKYKKRKELLQTKVSEDVRTRLQYSPGSRQLGVRQTSVIVGRGYRKFLLQCQAQ
jgi:hypothetical protein